MCIQSDLENVLAKALNNEFESSRPRLESRSGFEWLEKKTRVDRPADFTNPQNGENSSPYSVRESPRIIMNCRSNRILIKRVGQRSIVTKALENRLLAPGPEDDVRKCARRNRNPSRTAYYNITYNIPIWNNERENDRTPVRQTTEI